MTDLTMRETNTREMMRYFMDPQAGPQAVVADAVSQLAEAMVAWLPDGQDLTAGLKKLHAARAYFLRAYSEIAPPEDQEVSLSDEMCGEELQPEESEEALLEEPGFSDELLTESQEPESDALPEELEEAPRA